MATHSSILAWRILWTEETGGLQSIGSHRVGHNYSDLVCRHTLEKVMATHSNILAWINPGTDESGGLLFQFSSVQFSHSVVSDSLQPHELQHARPPRPSPTPAVHSDSRSSSQWCHPAISSSVVPFSSCPQSLPASAFFNESTLHIRWSKYWSFSFSIIPSKEHPGLISFRMDWLDLFAVRGTLKSLLQHHSSKASILWCSAFFTVQLSHPYMTTGKTIALTRWTLVCKVISLLLNMLSRLVINFLLRSKRLLSMGFQKVGHD